ncbi:MAG TPA: PAS domain S-box protein, partial [Polyangiaceae bacterium]
MTTNSSDQEVRDISDLPDGPEGMAWQLLDTGPDAMVVVDESGRIVLVNMQAEELFGYPRRELLGRAIEILIPERLRHTHEQRRREFTSAPRARPMGSGLELFGRRRDGAEFPVEISLSPLSLPGRVLISANIRDVSDRRQQEITLRRMQGHLLSAIESIPGAFAIFDSRDELVVCNS